MPSKPVPPLPPSPDFGDKPRTTRWTLVLAGLTVVMLLAGLTAITLGLFGPVILVGIVSFGVICLQYLLWGWLFERIYRQGKKISDD